ncbi:MAG: alkaline phosphatase D family protein [Bacteroidota bacterium]
MRHLLKLQIILIIGIAIAFSCCKTKKEKAFVSILPDNISRTWIGAEYWANPLQDWQLSNGRMECVVSGGERNVYLLTHEIDSVPGNFKMNIRTGRLVQDTSLSEGWIGFKIGIKGEFNDYRSSAVRGEGFPVGITTDGLLFLGKKDSSINKIKTSFDDILLELNAEEQNGKYQLKFAVYDKQHKLMAKINRTDIEPAWMEGGIAIVCHNGNLKEFPDKRIVTEYPDWGTVKGTERGGNVRFWFSDWEITGSKISTHKERAFGPILFAQHTLSQGTLKITAQMPPIGKEDGQVVDFQVKKDDGWKTVSQAEIDTLSRTANFKIKDWDTKKDISYRLLYKYYATGNKLAEAYFEGAIRKEPLGKDEIVVAAFTGNNDLGFPNNDIFESVKYHNPDILFFSGDQIYEGVGGYGAQRSPLKGSILDYLRKWYLYGWAYRDLMRDRPTVAIPDDHDMYHGNIWGAGGIATPEGLRGGKAQDMGGYKMPAIWVNMVERTQTSHFPDPYDSKPVEQSIGVYYTSMNYAGISFAVIEDRKFKSAPKTLLPEAKIYNGWAQNRKWDVLTKSDIPNAVLLGKRQLDFLENWTKDWSNTTWMKVVLSQTIFANVATLPKADAYSDEIVPKLRVLEEGDYPPDDIPVSDFDSNGWPQTPRNNALKIIRKAFAFHIAGDQHLGSTIQYGVDDWHDAGYAFCVPSISNVWPRRWYPAKEGQNRLSGSAKYSGDFNDGFGNKMSVSAVSNPVFTGNKPSKLYDRATGYGIVRFNKKSRDITMECWPRQANPAVDNQYSGWPITINQQDNYNRKAIAFLPNLEIEGMENPVIQIIDEENNEIIYSLRINGNSFRPKVFKQGLYTIKIGEPGTEKDKVLTNISSLSPDEKKNIEVQF